MVTLIDAEKVKYLCSCKRFKPLSYLYYCKYCKPISLKCKECVLHELDQKYFCPYCFDNKVQKEVVALKFRCGTCYSCPCCKNSLIIRASSLTSSQKAAAAAAAAAANSVSVASPIQQSATSSQTGSETPSAQNISVSSTTSSNTTSGQKVYYLICGFCRWSSRDVGIPDATSTPVNMKPPENPHIGRINELLKAYKTIASREKLEKERKKYPTIKRRQFNLSSSSFGSISSSTAIMGPGISSLSSDKYGILAPAIKRIHGTGGGGLSQGKEQQINIEEQFKSLVEKSQTVDNFDELSDDFFTKNINVNTFTTISQRHSNPEIQSSRSIDLYPLNKLYVSKESKRCNGCEHNVLKPESNITSIKFKLHQMAIFLIPEVRIVSIPHWKLDQPNEVILSITNRYEGEINISFQTIGDKQVSSNFQPTAKISFGVNNEHENLTIQLDRTDNARAHVASLKPLDQATNGFVCFRRENKIAICCQVTPLLSDIDKRVKIWFNLKHFVNPINQTDSNQTTISSSQVASPSSSTSVQSPPSTPNNQNPFQTTNPIVQTICIDLGPLKIEDGLRVINRPKYIDDCFVLSS